VAARADGESERDATKRVVPHEHRSSFRWWQKRYDQQGFEGLIDRRIGPESKMPPEVRAAICTLRRADPNFDVEKIVAHVAEHHGFKTSATQVKGILRQEGLARRRGPCSGQSPGCQWRVELGGMKLVEAACQETGYVQALTIGIIEHVKDLPRPAAPRAPETTDRDQYGRFLPEYNERYRKGPDDAIGPGFASVSEKRVGKDPARLQISQCKPETLERKLVALLSSPLIGSGRWDGMRVARGDLLGELCGCPYMPSTLDLFTRELKYAGVSSTLWEVHGRLWLKQTAQWGSNDRAALLYVDGSTKAVWTRFFSQSTNVKEVGRLMPGLEVVAFHTGYGVPLWFATFSGHAPLVTMVPELLGKAEQFWGDGSVERIVVIDAESNSVHFLKGLEQRDTPVLWVTRLRDDWVRGKELFNRNNYRPYRKGERVRSAMAGFNDPDGGKFRMRVVELERASGNVVYLGASSKLREQDWKPQELADLYFKRWPAQEANFRAVNQATGFKKIHGYGKRLVDNVSVITELDELKRKASRAQESQDRKGSEVERREARVREEEKVLRRRLRRQETVERYIAERLKASRPLSASTKKLVKEQGELAKEVVKRTKKLTKGRDLLEKAQVQLERTGTKIEGYEAARQKLEGRRQIFAHDVELDSLLSLMKVGLTLLVTFVLKEYLGNAKMEVSTFLERVATLPARIRMTPDLEIVAFEYNRRDPEVMGLLAGFCDEINARGLRMRSGRKLRVEVAPAPPARPPPPGSRARSGGRFHR
jgi:transposase